MKNFYRKDLEKIEKDLFNKKILVLIWSRRVWKTSILKIFQEKEERKNIFIDLDIESNKKILSSYENFLEYISFYRKENEEIVIFLDEFQTIKNSWKILKNIYDNNPEIKIICSGSSSLDILKELWESLAWRKRVFKIFWLSFEEFLLFKEWENFLEIYRKTIWKKIIPSEIQNKIQRNFKEFLIFWSYPEISLLNNFEDKKNELSDIYSSYIKNDIINFFKLKNIDWFQKILQFLAINTWNILNKSELSSFSWVDIKTVNSYLKILENTFVISLIKPFFTNKNKEISKSPKIYFLDNWIRNFILNNFEMSLDIRLDKWIIFENFVYWEFVKKIWKDVEIKYWNEKWVWEVDFLFEKDWKIFLFEIKSAEKFKKNFLHWLKKFSNIYEKNFSEIKKFLIFNWNSEDFSIDEEKYFWINFLELSLIE